MMSEMNQALRQRITSNPGIFGGQPIIRGLRFRVTDVLEYLAAGETRESLLKEFSFLQDEDITASLNYAAEMTAHRLIAAE